MPLPIDYHSHPQAHSIKPYTPALLSRKTREALDGAQAELR